jgi:hypothetical protein
VCSSDLWWLTHFFGGNPPLPGSDPDGDGVSAPTLAGAIQFPATHRAPDPGRVNASLTLRQGLQ